jgi:hypothetical protein
MNPSLASASKGKPGRDVVLVEGVRTPFLQSGTEYVLARAFEMVRGLGHSIRLN